jgi:hypothetical protein
MKTILMSLVFGAVLAAQPYGGRPGYAPGAGDVRGGYRDNGFAERIARGERMGFITPREASRLWKMERDLRSATEHAYRTGYGISPRERDQLARMSARLDAAITHEMRDRERNFRGGPGRF